MALGKKVLLLAAFCGLAWGQTGLTTIQDKLFKADGTLFNGTLTIQWSTFDATNIGTIVQQSTSVAVVNGNLLVSLAPNATAAPPANVYTVHYQSDGREQFDETWSVPVSTVPLKVAVVRTGTQAASSGGTGGGTVSNDTPIVESSIIGLQADLAQRPLKGVGYGSSAVAVVNANGQIETVVGDVGNCVFVDGTSGPCGQPVYSDAETPGGIVDGTNNTLTLVNTPLGSSLMLFRNGLYLTPGFDFTLTGSSIQFAVGAIPRPGDTLTASYRVDTSASGNVVAFTTSSGNPITSVPAQVICGAAGSTTGATAWTSLGGCDIAAAGLLPGDRIEMRFTLAHTGATSGFSLQLNWGNTTVLSRTAAAQDAAVAGSAEAAMASTGALVSVASFGTVMPFLPGVLNAPAQAGLQVQFRVALAQAGPDTVTLTNYTVLRYSGH